jgi:hypothetical protein
LLRRLCKCAANNNRDGASIETLLDLMDEWWSSESRQHRQRDKAPGWPGRLDRFIERGGGGDGGEKAKEITDGFRGWFD